jgi:hypothetical protein
MAPDTVPARTVAILDDPETAPHASRMVRVMEDAAKSIGVAVRDAPCHDDTEIEAVMAALAQGGGGLLGSRTPISDKPASVGTMCFPLVIKKPCFFSPPMISARVAGVPMPLASFRRSRRTSSSTKR